MITVTLANAPLPTGGIAAYAFWHTGRALSEAFGVCVVETHLDVDDPLNYQCGTSPGGEYMVRHPVQIVSGLVTALSFSSGFRAKYEAVSFGVTDDVVAKIIEECERIASAHYPQPQDSSADDDGASPITLHHISNAIIDQIRSK